MDEQYPLTATLRRIPLHILLICIGAFGPVVFNIIYFSMGSVTPNYDELRLPIGRLELMQHGWIQSANFIFLGLLTVVFAVGLRRELANGFGAVSIPLSYLATGSGFVLMGILAREPAHTYVSFFSFFSIVANFLLFSRRFYRDPRWEDWTAFTIICTVLMFLLMGIFWYSDDKDGAYAGAFERMLEITRLVWSVVFMLRLLEGRRLSTNTSRADLVGSS